jgi:NADPH-dependent curcumin reductase CurA
MHLIRSGATMQGFLVGQPNFGPAYFQEHQEKLGAWIADGSVKTKLHVTEGIDNAPQGFLELFEGKNFGKAVLKIR